MKQTVLDSKASSKQGSSFYGAISFLDQMVLGVIRTYDLKRKRMSLTAKPLGESHGAVSLKVRNRNNVQKATSISA